MHCLSMNARDDRVNFAIIAPGFSQNKNQGTPKFQFTFTNQSQHLTNIRQQADVARINQLLSQSKQKKSF